MLPSRLPRKSSSRLAILAVVAGALALPYAAYAQNAGQPPAPNVTAGGAAGDAIASNDPASKPGAPAGPNMGGPGMGGGVAAADYQLGPGDRVRITVFGQQDLSGEYAVDGTGTLSFPLVGQVHAGSLTAGQLGKALEGSLSPNYIKNPHVSVEVLSYRPFYILGEVKTPGSYAYVSGMTVLNAVALAGGFTYRARDDDFRLQRTAKDGSKTQVDAEPTTPVQPGDVITVRERYF
ncbi:protein involved in polysaccharide export with SLBB domain [Nitrospirillum amazonense]|uniref:Protein involved in polysaccharide export with SLBB domain n=1 Tax=Nitrospirillum amazonense TaxID=28077 RepID=A0A560FPT6_9PROT|nr:polysaccharide biosynthesis/export family protein [Nitrospirillum amazonense]TWB23618.1 protein involved in polysaccharide export with SLBB domain [Nitrospirillum amazonense]